VCRWHSGCITLCLCVGGTEPVTARCLCDGGIAAVLRGVCVGDTEPVTARRLCRWLCAPRCLCVGGTTAVVAQCLFFGGSAAVTARCLFSDSVLPENAATMGKRESLERNLFKF
jgi:hypothetical protein